MSDKIVLRIYVRRDDEVVFGRRGKRDFMSLGKRKKLERDVENRSLYGSNDIFVAKHDKILNKSFACIWRKTGVALKEKRRDLGREIGRFFGIACRHLERVRYGRVTGIYAYLRDKSHQFSELLGVFIWIEFVDLANAVVMIPLLQKLFLVPNRIPFNEILKLRKI